MQCNVSLLTGLFLGEFFFFFNLLLDFEELMPIFCAKVVVPSGLIVKPPTWVV